MFTTEPTATLAMQCQTPELKPFELTLAFHPELYPKFDGAVRIRFILNARPAIFWHDYIA